MIARARVATSSGASVRPQLFEPFRGVADLVERAAETAAGPAHHDRLRRREDPCGDHRADGRRAGLALAAHQFDDDQLDEVGTGRPHHADDQRHHRISGRAGDHRVRLPQAKADESHQQAERDHRHAKAEQEQHRKAHERGVLARIVAQGRGEDDRGQDEEETGGKAEARPFDLLAGDPRWLAAKAHDLARQDRQQDDHREDALHVLVDVGEGDEDRQRDPSGISQRRKRGAKMPSGKEARAIRRT